MSAKTPGDTVLIAQNRKARFQYEVLETVEAGLVLRGTEVKSLREGNIQLGEAYAEIDRGEVFLLQAHIGDYSRGNLFNHEPTRRRKLLLHKQEIHRLEKRAREKGYTLIPLDIYFKQGRAKITLAVCRGKAEHDKRATLRERQDQREAERAMRKAR